MTDQTTTRDVSGSHDTPRTKTQVNGIDIVFSDRRSESTVRRLAASLEQGHDGVRKISNATPHDALVLMESGTAFRAPDGWRIEAVFVGSNGGCFVRLNETEGDA